MTRAARAARHKINNTKSDEPLIRTLTISTLPPDILQLFNHNLLDTPMPGMRLPQYYRSQYEERIKARYKPGTRKYKDYEELMKVYEELYGWKKAKEDYDKSEKKEVAKRPAIPVEAINRVRGELGKNLRSAFGLA